MEPNPCYNWDIVNEVCFGEDCFCFGKNDKPIWVNPEYQAWLDKQTNFNEDDNWL